MKIIEWNGEIGAELFNSKVSEDLKMAQGDDITSRFSSVGGSIFEGADILSSLMDYKRDYPNAKMNIEIKGVAASMGSAIASSPVWDSVSVDDTTAYMIHRPTTFSFGDFESMKSTSTFLERASDTFATLYSNKSKKPKDEIHSMMKETTWLYGQAIVDNGFADSVNSTENQDDLNMIIAGMKNKFAEMCSNQKKLHSDDSFDVMRASACFKTNMVNPEQSDNNKPSLIEGNSIMEVPMNEEELKKDNPELYNALMKKGADNEREVNSARVKALTEMKAKEDYKDIPEVSAVLDKCIEDGTSMVEAQPLVMASIMRVMKDPARMAAIESPEDIVTDIEKPVMKTSKKFEV